MNIFEKLLGNIQILTVDELATTIALHGQWLADNATGKQADLSNCNLSGLSLRRADLRQANLAGAIMQESDLRESDFTGADFTGARMEKARMEDGRFVRAIFSKANLQGVAAARADFGEANFAEANLSGGDFQWTHLRGCNFAGAAIAADFTKATLDDADISEAKLNGCILKNAYLGGVKLPSWIPAISNIDSQILAAITSPDGNINMEIWRSKSAGTLHRRAAWAIHIAGGAGAVLEGFFRTELAATLIYIASRPGKPAPKFIDMTDARGLQDLTDDAKIS